MTQPAPPEPLRIEFDAAAVTLDSVQRAAYKIAREASAEIVVSGNKIACTLHPRTEFSVDELAHHLRNAVTDEVLRARIAAETAPLRNLIFALAFSRTGLADDEADGR